MQPRRPPCPRRAPEASRGTIVAAAPDEVTFRVAGMADALCIGVLGTQVFLDTYATGGIRPSLAREVLQHLSTEAIESLLAASGAQFILAERAGHLIGFADLALGATQALVPAWPSAELRRLYVHERFTRRGIGAALLRHAEAHAAATGTAALWLTAWVENVRALAFYARQNYAELGAVPYVFENESYENRVFAKSLSGIAVTLQ